MVKIGQAINCEPVKPKELIPYLINYTTQTHQLSLTRPAAGLLVDLVGDEAGLLECEIDKLATYLAEPGRKVNRIEPQVVQDLVGNSRQFNAFNVIDAMTEGNTSLALRLFDQMISRSRDASFTAVGAFAWHFRRLYNARVMLDKRMPDQAIIAKLRLWGRVDEFMRQAKCLSIRQLAGILKQLMKIDLDSKTGGATVQSGLEKLIIGFCRSAGRVA